MVPSRDSPSKLFGSQTGGRHPCGNHNIWLASSLAIRNLAEISKGTFDNAFQYQLGIKRAIKIAMFTLEIHSGEQLMKETTPGCVLCVFTHLHLHSPHCWTYKPSVMHCKVWSKQWINEAPQHWSGRGYNLLLLIDTKQSIISCLIAFILTLQCKHFPNHKNHQGMSSRVLTPES